jgi:hypothetical protein
LVKARLDPSRQKNRDASVVLKEARLVDGEHVPFGQPDSQVSLSGWKPPLLQWYVETSDAPVQADVPKKPVRIAAMSLSAFELSIADLDV